MCVCMYIYMCVCSYIHLTTKVYKHEKVLPFNYNFRKSNRFGVNTTPSSALEIFLIF